MLLGLQRLRRLTNNRSSLQHRQVLAKDFPGVDGGSGTATCPSGAGSKLAFMILSLNNYDSHIFILASNSSIGNLEWNIIPFTFSPGFRSKV